MQVLNAFALTGEEKYKAHVVTYLEAWLERTAGGATRSALHCRSDSV
jgi:hypothetical protein